MMAKARGRWPIATLLLVALLGTLWVARIAEQETQFERKRHLAAELQVLAKRLMASDRHSGGLGLLPRRPAVVRWDLDYGGHLREIALAYEYQVPCRLSAPVTVTLHVRLAVEDGVIRVDSARVDEPFLS